MENWVCSCGKSNSSKFCINCGKPKPAPAPAPTPQNGWTCSCGHQNTAGRFCMKCGQSKPQVPGQTLPGWKCLCGHVNTTRFCVECGKAKAAVEEEQLRLQQEAEARRQEEIRRQQEAEAQRQEELRRQQEEEARRQEELRRQQEEEARRQEELRRQQEEEARRQEELRRQQEEEEARRQEELRRQQEEEEARRQEEELRRQQEEDVRHQENSVTTGSADIYKKDDSTPDGKTNPFEKDNGGAKPKNMKLIIAAVVAVLLIVIGGGVLLSGSGFDSKCKEYIAVTEKINKTMDGVAELSGNPQEEKQQAIINELKKESEELAKVKESIGKEKADKPEQKAAILELIDRNNSAIQEYIKILSYSQVTGSQDSNPARKAFLSLVNGVAGIYNISAIENIDSLQIAGKDAKGLLAFDDHMAKLKQYADKKLEHDKGLFQKYNDALTKVHDAQKQQGKPVFLAQTVEKKDDNTIAVTGVFYNGQVGITLIRINTMDLDITLKNGDTEVASAKGVQIAVKGAESVSVATGATSAPITVDVMLDVAGKTFDNFEIVNVPGSVHGKATR